MHYIQSMHKGIHTSGNKALLVGAERADAATSCHIPMTALQSPTSSSRTAQNSLHPHQASWALKHCPLGKELCLRVRGQKRLAQCSPVYGRVRTHQHTWTLFPVGAQTLSATLPGFLSMPIPITGKAIWNQCGKNSVNKNAECHYSNSSVLLFWKYQAHATAFRGQA